MYSDFDLFVFIQLLALSCEVFMVVTISYLFSKPLIKLSAESQSVQFRNGNDIDENKIEQHLKENMLINLATKLLVLSGIALGSTLIMRIIIMAAFPYCEAIGDLECWAVYVSYAAWPVDTLINIVCLLLTFKNGKIYYDKYCQSCHGCIISKCLAKYYARKVRKYTDKYQSSSSLPAP